MGQARGSGPSTLLSPGASPPSPAAVRERELRDDEPPRAGSGAAGVKPLVPARRSGVAAVAAGTPASPKMRCCAVCT